MNNIATNQYNRYYIIGIVLLIIGYTFLIFNTSGFLYDVGFWQRWGWCGKELGIYNVYGCYENNYLPLYHYVLNIFAHLFNDQDTFNNNIHLLRFFSFAFDIVGLIAVASILNKKYSSYKVVFWGLINFAFCYNSIMWGQVDAVLGYFGFAAVVAIWRKKILLSSLLLALAICLKLQAIIFFPIVGILFLNQFSIKEWLLKLPLLIISCAAFITIIISRFLIYEGRYWGVYEVVRTSVDFIPMVTVGAANIWSIIWNRDADYMYDYNIISNHTTYKQLGTWMFCISSFFALWPIARNVLYKILSKPSQILTIDKIFLASGLVILSFYMFNTQMHERYSHPAFLFLIAYGWLKKDYIPIILFSIAYFLNMEAQALTFGLNNYDTFIFQRRTIGVMYLLLMGYSFVKLYYTNSFSKQYIKIRQ